VTVPRLPVPLRRTALLAAAAALCLGLAACGHKESHPTTADTEGQYVDAGPLAYQVQISRQLNPYSLEDHAYLAGVTAPQPTSTQLWFAVFMWAKNQTHENAPTATNFDIVDTQGNRYRPVAINPQANPFAWTGQTLRPLGTEPAPDSPASWGPTQGGELLFKLNASIFSNRPLTLEIYAPGESKPSSVSLDL
jgi:hypothetical protein